MGRHAAPTRPDGFTPREHELLVLLSKGYRATEAAQRMHISKHTATDYLRQILTKLDASTQAEAVYRAVKEGVIQ